MKKERKKLPIVLVVGMDLAYLVKLEKWLRDYCVVYLATSYENCVKFMNEKGANILIVEGPRFQWAAALKFKFPDTLVCALTDEHEFGQEISSFQSIQKPLEKETAISAIMNLWLLHEGSDKRADLIENGSGMVEVYRREPQKELEVLYCRLKDQPEVSFEAVALRHEDHLHRTNFCITLQRGCKGGCIMCWSPRIKNNTRIFSAEVNVAQWEILHSSYKAYGCLDGTITDSCHGGGDPRFGLKQYCDYVNTIERKYGKRSKYRLNLRHISTSIGGVNVFKGMSKAGLDEYCMCYELSAHSSDKSVRDYLLPMTRGDKIEQSIEFLAENAAKYGRINHYRHMQIGSLTDNEKEADGISKLLRGTGLKVIVTNVEPGCLSQFPKILTDEDGEKFVALLREREIDAVFNRSLGNGMVRCGMHIDLHDRKQILTKI